ncbi:MAG TPA: DUF3443 family protein [Candidatus Eisenbacteria bacterium]|nr:DUF3443 family protein [Candidatus Eisenbacteria bacterium]
MVSRQFHSNADAVFRTSEISSLSSLGVPSPSSFVCGLPFFFGRKVAAIDARSTPAGLRPYGAYQVNCSVFGFILPVLRCSHGPALQLWFLAGKLSRKRAK